MDTEYEVMSPDQTFTWTCTTLADLLSFGYDDDTVVVVTLEVPDKQTVIRHKSTVGALLAMWDR